MKLTRENVELFNSLEQEHKDIQLMIYIFEKKLSQSEGTLYTEHLFENKIRNNQVQKIIDSLNNFDLTLLQEIENILNSNE